MRKYRHLAGVALSRVLGRLRSPDARRVLVTVVGVALAVGLLTTVTAVALQLSAGTTVQSDDVDYWVVPEASGSSSVAVAVGGPKLGDVHAVTDRLERRPSVTYATPLQLAVLDASAGNRSEYVLFVGAIPARTNRSVAGLPTGALRAGDPYYANGTYDGTWTGQAVVSESAAQLLDARPGDSLTPSTGSERDFAVTRVARGDLSTGLGPVPVVLVHLAELQQITGSARGDQASQLLVSTNDPGVRSTLAGVYPRTRVVARGGLTAPEVSTASLPLAMAIAALVAAVLVGVLFVATMMGLEVTADRVNLATMAALGVSWRARAVLVATETVLVSVVGGAGGTLLGAVGVVAVNYASGAVLGVGTVARFHPALLAYGLGTAVLIGLLASPYPVWLGARTDLREVLAR